MASYDPQALSLPERTALLQSGVAPRPIALVSTVSEAGQPNLSPFSFFNLFGLNPPMVGFSASRRARDGSLKDTYRNLVATKECVIQAVSYPMVRQVSLSSTEYPADVDEFVKSGLTPVASQVVKPPRVAESPFALECVLRQMIPLGEAGGAGNLALCEVVRIHVADDLLPAGGGPLDPQRLDLVARMGGDFYARAAGDAVFSVAKPLQQRGVGFDRLPEAVRSSEVLTGNDLGQLANVERVPTLEEAAARLAEIPLGEASPQAFARAERAGDARAMLGCALTLRPSPGDRRRFERAAKVALAREDVALAWAALLG